MKRRELFKFLAAAPAALVATPAEPPVEKIQDRMTIKLPAAVPLGSTVMISNISKDAITIVVMK